MNRNQQQQIINADDLGTLALSTATSFAKRHKVLTTSYLYGLTTLLLILLMGGGTKLTIDQKRQYNRIMNTIDLQAEYNAADRYHAAYANYYQSKGWLSCDAHCQHYKSIMDKRKFEWDEIKAEGNARMSDAKNVAGLFSEVGVGEVTDSFWEYFASGKRFAKRQSWWDAIFIGFRSMGRDEHFSEYVLRMLMQVLINFSMGLLMALVIFIFGLWNIIQTYQPNPITALVFFVTAVCAAFAFVSTYLLTLYGAAAGGLYGMVKMAESSGRLENGRRGGGGRINAQGYRMPRNHRPHYQ